MKTYLTRWLAAATLALTGLTFPVQAQQALVAGRDYSLIEPAQLTDNPQKIGVTEYFSYACPHCNVLNPSLTRWAAKLPADVEFKRVPVSFSPFYQLMAKLFYTLDALGELPRLDTAAFAAIHEKGLKLIDEKSIQAWAVAQGIEAKKFSVAFNSFGVTGDTKRAEQLTKNGKIQGVPAIVVDGRYLVIGKDIKSPDELLILADKVIAKARYERSQK